MRYRPAWLCLRLWFGTNQTIDYLLFTPIKLSNYSVRGELLMIDAEYSLNPTIHGNGNESKVANLVPIQDEIQSRSCSRAATVEIYPFCLSCLFAFSSSSFWLYTPWMKWSVTRMCSELTREWRTCVCGAELTGEGGDDGGSGRLAVLLSNPK